jgi:phosphoserine phosphatase
MRLKGMEVGKILESEINAAKHLRLMHGAREFIEWLKKHYNVYIITGSFQSMADYFGRLFGVEAFGTRLEKRSGLFTGRIELVMNQNNKASMAIAIARRTHIDLASSFALGDQIEDSKMLGVVGNPICVKPGRGLIKFNCGRWKTVHSLADAMTEIRQKTEGCR